MASKVSIIEPVGGHGGMSAYDQGLCCGISYHGIDAALFTSAETQPPPKADAKYSFYPIFSKIYGNRPEWVRGFYFGAGLLTAVIKSTLQKRRICHFHWFQIGPREVLSAVICRIFFRRMIVTVHDVQSFADDQAGRFWESFCYGAVKCILVHNQFSLNELAGRFPGLREKIKVVPHGNYLHALGRVPDIKSARESLELAADEKVLLFFGQIKTVKGLDLLLSAMPEVIKKIPDVRLVVAGRVWKTNFDFYRDLIQNLKISEHVTCRIEYIPDEDISLYFSAADLLVLPYRQIYQSGVVLLSMSHAKAFLASDIEGFAEMVENGENGFLFKSEDIGDLALRIIELLSKPDLLKAAGERGLQTALSRYDWKRIGEVLAGIYREIDG